MANRKIRLALVASLALLLQVPHAEAQTKAGKKQSAKKPAADAVSAESRKCVACHEQKTPGIVAQ